MKSMTGFGSATASTPNGAEVHIEIASYNKKQLDVRISIPNDLIKFETKLRKEVSEKIFRGSVNIKVEITPSPEELNSFFEINNALAAAYIKSVKKLQKKLKLNGEININEVLNVPGIIQESTGSSTIPEEILLKTINRALDNIVTMRSNEGVELKKDIKARLKKIAELLKKIKPLTVKIPLIQKERLLNNLKNADLNIDSNDERVMKEIVIFTDRYDVSEEITRIESHFIQFNSLINKSEPVGRAMEFMIQELQREINTLGTKAAHTEISPLVVNFKTELEKIREQIQNVE
jgi:uncharacterized protein (TIGR00255 family)